MGNIAVMLYCSHAVRPYGSNGVVNDGKLLKLELT